MKHKPSEDAKIGARLRSLRETRGVKQVFVAERLGISNNFLSELEAGKRRWLATTVAKYESLFR